MNKNHRNILICTILLVVFLALRLPAIGQPYHQDEYRWATQANPVIGDKSPHPPLTLWLLKATGFFAGYDALRYPILLVSVLVLILLFWVSLSVSKDLNTGYIAATVFAINAYSIIASLQIDIDGAILPFFLLLTYLGYLKILRGDKFSALFFGVAVVGGLITKLSYILVLAAIAVDWGWDNVRFNKINWNKLLRRAVAVVPWVLLAIGAVFLFFADALKPVLEYASGFKSLNFSERAYGDMGFKVIKSFILVSPFILVLSVIAFLDAKLRRQYRFWWIYLGINFIFYFVLFDFTRLTIERYLMFMIAPLCILIAPALRYIIPDTNLFLGGIRRVSGREWIGVALLFYILILTVTLPQDILPLNPKSAYVEHVGNLDFNFLIPFTGGSGPVGFYFSAMAILFISTVTIWTAWRIYSGKKNTATVLILLLFGFVGNLLFGLEYLYGWLNGSVPSVVRAATGYATDKPDIKEVITYYDHGAYYLRLSGKYSARFYTAPTRDYTTRINSYRGHYMIVDFPAIDKNSAYWSLISRCPIENKFSSGYVDGYIFDCTVLE